MDVQGERIVIVGDSLSHPDPDSAPTIQAVTRGSNRASSVPGDLLASMLLDQGAAAVQIDAKIGRSAISFLNNEPVNDLVAADAAFQPTKVIVMLGTNDIGRDLGATQQAMAQIRDAYQGMGAEVWAIGPMAYVGRSEGLNALAPDVFGVMQSVFGADKTIDARPLSAVEGRTGDGVHFTYAAALPTAQALAQALITTSSTSTKLKKGLIIAGIGVAGIAVVGYALSALKKRQLLGPIGMLISPRLVGPALMAYDARRNLESRPTPGGKAWGRKPSDFDPFELRRGIEVEYEHTADRREAQKIAMDHLVEDPRYYRKLAKIHLDGVSAARDVHADAASIRARYDARPDLTEIQRRRPRPLHKFYGKNPTPEQIAASKAEHSRWNSEYRRALKEHRAAVEGMNELLRRNQS